CRVARSGQLVQSDQTVGMFGIERIEVDQDIGIGPAPSQWSSEKPDGCRGARQRERTEKQPSARVPGAKTPVNQGGQRQQAEKRDPQPTQRELQRQTPITAAKSFAQRMQHEPSLHPY